jgi:hypothetical protein
VRPIVAKPRIVERRDRTARRVGERVHLAIIIVSLHDESHDDP